MSFWRKSRLTLTPFAYHKGIQLKQLEHNNLTTNVSISDSDEVFTRNEAAAFLKISIRYLATLTKVGDIRSFLIGTRRMYLRSELIRYARALMD
ncbi:MAG: DNA-binding protein [Phycisphaera sp.]|nr:MAG: DNA-binding protein [Phycisphaera sp.]